MNWILKFKNDILSIVFPISCLNCGKKVGAKAGGWICDDCLSFVEFNPVFLCPACGKNSYLGRVCKRCADKSFLDGVIAMEKYSNPLMKNLIKSLKFRYITDLEPVVNRLVRKFCLKYTEIFPKNAILVPVPLHPLRFRQRGFNQAEFIAKFVSGALGYGISKTLKRARYTYRQSELPKEMKEDNIKGAFIYCHSEPRHIVGAKNLVGVPMKSERPTTKVSKVVILIDDVYTSGATMQECARTLKEAGAKEVWGFVLARG